MTMLEKLTKRYALMEEFQPKEPKSHASYACCFIRDDLNEVIMGEYEFPRGTFRIWSLCRDGIHFKYEPKGE